MPVATTEAVHSGVKAGIVTEVVKVPAAVAVTSPTTTPFEPLVTRLPGA